MPKKLAAPAAAVLALALAVPAFAGGDHCAGATKTSAMAAGSGSCSASKTTATAWTGAWLQRTDHGVRVAELASGGPAQRSGLKVGDVVLAVNGWSLADAKSREMCAANANCCEGSAVTYTVQRGSSQKTVKVKLAKMPADASERFANRRANFEPALAAAVLPALD